MNRDLINRGEICETLVSTAGWRYLTSKLDEFIAIDKDMIMKLSLSAAKIEDLENIRGAAERIRCYEFIKNLPNEAIAKKTKALKEPKQEENIKW